MFILFFFYMVIEASENAIIFPTDFECKNIYLSCICM